METMLQDFRYAARMLFKRPGFFAVAVVTLALGIGANSAIFSVVNAVLLRPLPYPDSDRIVRIIQNRPAAPEGMLRRMAALSTDDLLAWRDRSETLEQMAAYRAESLTLTGGDEPIRLSGTSVSPAMFPLLRAQPLMGRVFDASEEKPGSNSVVILSHSAWQRYFGSDPGILERTVTLEGRGYAVVGVMPPDFEFPNRESEFWSPMVMTPTVRVPGERVIRVVQTIARLREGVTIEQATAEANIIFKQLREADAAFEAQAFAGRGGPEPGDGPGPGVRGGPAGPGARGEPVVVTRGGPRGGPDGGPDGGRGGDPAGPGEGGPRGQRGQRGGGAGFIDVEAGATIELVRIKDELVAPVRSALMVLLVAVGFVLLIACANVANLLLARAASRQQEVAIRTALGAGRGRLIRQVLTESLLLSLMGGALGTVLAYWGISMLMRLGPGNIPRLEEIGIDGSVFLFTIGVSVATGLLFGIVPALRLTGADQMRVIKEGASAGASGFDLFRRNRTRSLLAIAEIAMAMVLLVGAGLLINSFTKLSNIDPGYDPENVLTFQIALPQARYPEAQRQSFYDQLLSSLSDLPGVQYAAASNNLPLQSGGVMRISMEIVGRPPATRAEEVPLADVRIVSEDYTEAMGIKVVDGRDFNETDRPGQPPVVMVNQTFANRYLAGESAVGKQLRLGPAPSQIVGVVTDVRHAGLDAEPQPELYINVRQAPVQMSRGLGGLFFAVRTSGAPSEMIGSIRGLVRQMDAQLTVDNVAEMTQRVSNSVAQPRFYAVLLGIFATVALLLAAIGIYGIMAYSVAQRTREIGIRIALGAERNSVLAMVLRQGITLTAIGLAIGLAGTLAVTRYLDSLLFGLTPFDPLTFAGVSVLLSLVALVACYVPARRATKVDPIIALRYE